MDQIINQDAACTITTKLLHKFDTQIQKIKYGATFNTRSSFTTHCVSSGFTMGFSAITSLFRLETKMSSLPHTKTWLKTNFITSSTDATCFLFGRTDSHTFGHPDSPNNVECTIILASTEAVNFEWVEVYFTLGITARSSGWPQSTRPQKCNINTAMHRQWLDKFNFIHRMKHKLLLKQMPAEKTCNQLASFSWQLLQHRIS